MPLSINIAEGLNQELALPLLNTHQQQLFKGLESSKQFTLLANPKGVSYRKIQESHVSEVPQVLKTYSAQWLITGVISQSAKQLSLKFSIHNNENVLITVADITGRILISQSRTVVDGGNQLNINLNDLPEGSYVIRLQSNSNTTIQTIVKQ